MLFTFTCGSLRLEHYLARGEPPDIMKNHELLSKYSLISDIKPAFQQQHHNIRAISEKIVAAADVSTVRHVPAAVCVVDCSSYCGGVDRGRSDSASLAVPKTLEMSTIAIPLRYGP